MSRYYEDPDLSEAVERLKASPPARAVVERLHDALDMFIRDSEDPGSEALAASYEAARWLRETADAPLPGPEEADAPEIAVAPGQPEWAACQRCDGLLVRLGGAGWRHVVTEVGSSVCGQPSPPPEQATEAAPQPEPAGSEAAPEPPAPAQSPGQVGLRLRAASRLRAMAEFHREGMAASLAGIARWYEIVHAVDDNAEDIGRADASARALLGFEGAAVLPQEEVDRFQRLSELPVDWDSYGALPVDAECAARAQRVLVSLQEGVRIYPMADGGVELSWDDDDLDLLFSPGGGLKAWVEDRDLVPDPEETPEHVAREAVVRMAKLWHSAAALWAPGEARQSDLQLVKAVRELLRVEG